MSKRNHRQYDEKTNKRKCVNRKNTSWRINNTMFKINENDQQQQSSSSSLSSSLLSLTFPTSLITNKFLTNAPKTTTKTKTSTATTEEDVKNILDVTNFERHPLNPMLASPIKSIKELNRFDLKNFIYEEKFDGERVFCCFNGDKNKIIRPTFYSRNMHKIEKNLINITTKIPIDDWCILDGEVCYTDCENGELIPIYKTGYRNYLKQVYYVFDVQFFDGCDVTKLQLIERKKLLEKLVQENDTFKLVKYHNVESTETLNEKFNITINAGGEGLIIKRKSTLYLPNDRTNWKKLKRLHLTEKREEYDLYVHRVEKDVSNLWSILVCGYYNNENVKITNDDDNEEEKSDKYKDNIFTEVCRVSSGIRDEHRQILLPLINTQTGYPLKRASIIVTIKGDGVTSNRSIRFPTFVRFRFDINSIDEGQFK